MKVKLRLSQTFEEATLRGGYRNRVEKILSAERVIDLPSDYLVSNYDFANEHFLVNDWAFSVDENIHVGVGTFSYGAKGFQRCNFLADFLSKNKWESIKIQDVDRESEVEGVYATRDDLVALASLVLDGIRHREIRPTTVSDRMINEDPLKALGRMIDLAEEKKPRLSLLDGSVV